MSLVAVDGGPASGPLSSMADTQALARRIAARLPDGQLLLLSGPLGAGKTTLVAALATTLGSTAQVASPTYTLVHEYPGPQGVLAHVDLYRLPDDHALPAGQDASALVGLDDLLQRARAVVVEWGERLLPAYPNAWHLELQRVAEARGYRWLLPAPDPADADGSTV